MQNDNGGTSGANAEPAVPPLKDKSLLRAVPEHPEERSGPMEGRAQLGSSTTTRRFRCQELQSFTGGGGEGQVNFQMDLATEQVVAICRDGSDGNVPIGTGSPHIHPGCRVQHGVHPLAQRRGAGRPERRVRKSTNVNACLEEVLDS